MPAPEVARSVEQGLESLYQDNLHHEPVSFFDSARGYVPAAAALPAADRFAICIVTTDGTTFRAGDHDVPFAVQSISKVFAYGLALADRGRDRVLARVGVEPSGEAFNAIEFDERRQRPFNPMVNAGAMVTSDLVRGADPDQKFHRLLASMRLYAANDDLAVDERTFRAEIAHADRNRAIAYLMRSQGMLDGDVEATLRLYLRQCAVRVTCTDLAVMAATLANGCVNPLSRDRVLPRHRVRDVLSVMYTCGMYDAAGQWAYDVGVPAKSGVSGGILAVVPGKLGIGIWSPGLDAHGNSARGVAVCRDLSERLGLHVFATEAEDHMTRVAPG